MISKNGYSAIEMLIVLGLISILVTLGLFNYSKQIPHYELREASRAVISDLRKIRQMAVTKGIPLTLDFYPGDGQDCEPSYAGKGAYCETNDLEEDKGEQVRYKLPQHVHFGTLGEVHKKPGCTSGCSAPPSNGITFQGDPPSATFNPNGTISAMGAVFLTNAPSRNEALAITVNITGRVRLWKWVGNEWQ